MKKFVIVVPSYNNKDWYDKNLKSVLNQNYSNFRIIYTDDCSPDGTGDLVEDFVNKRGNKKHLIKVIRNEKRVGAMKNIYDMIHSCEDDEIMVLADGDDFLAHPNVLNKLNNAYSNNDVWMTYGSYKHPNGQRGCCKPYEPKIVQTNSFRFAQWRASHLRTFYKWLFAKIPANDFYDPQGQWLDVAWDLAFMLPLLEMSGPRHKYIHDFMYVYNDANPISDYRIKLGRQGAMDHYIRTKPRYDRIDGK